MIGERARRLFALVAGAFALLLLRLAWVQVAEHEVWADEAARLVHRGLVLPYRRGRILSSDGEVLALDVEAYELAFAYRRFRREHPIGQVAHARTALELRAVTLGEAARNLERWASELVALTPAEVAAFRTGGLLETPSLALAATETPRAEARRGRASDVTFYVRALLGVDPRREARAMEERARGAPEASFLELLARERGIGLDELARERAEAWRASLHHLAFLGGQIDLAGDPASAPLDRLIDVLEESRRAVESAAASALFEEAAGFPPGRLAPAVLARAIDLEELRMTLRWDRRDLEDWTRRTRRSWLDGWRDGYALPRLVEELTLDPALPCDPDRVVSTLAALYAGREELELALAGRPRDWREVDELGVLRGFEKLFAGARAAPEPKEPVLPFQDPALRSLVAPSPWLLLDELRGPAGDGPAGAFGEAWRAALEGRGAAAREARFALARELVDGWEALFQAALAERFEAALAAAGPGDLGPYGGLLFRRGRIERLAERAAYVLMDYGERQRRLAGDPSYDVVYLLAGYPERYPGFIARDARRRERAVLAGDERPLAEALVGVVARADVRTLQRQREDDRRLRELSAKPLRSAAEEDELVALVASVLLPEEASGASGIEGFFDPELSGQNGFRDVRGLEGQGDPGQEVPPVDGLDLRLTLDSVLQRAAERVINHPTPPVLDPSYDPRWYADPIGAIVLMTPQGDVLAAASAPVTETPEDGGRRAIERTLRRPTFQPPGSVMKPLVAAYALDRRGLDPSVTVDCALIDDGRAGFGDVACWKSWGHGRLDLSDALKHSCNAYFAWLGEGLSTEDFRGMARAFGLGEATGVRTPPSGVARPGRRSGMAEAASEYLFQRELRDAERRRAGNGLAVVEATPMQVARAFAGLATGVLPTVRLVEAAGGVALPRAPGIPVPLGSGALDRVRGALARVTQEHGGTAYGTLDRGSLGFVLAAKTGSADLVGRAAREGDGRVRKHAWVAGWAPLDDPRFVLVVFVHDTSATSSHGAVHVARELLLQPEVRAWMGAQGIALEEPR